MLMSHMLNDGTMILLAGADGAAELEEQHRVRTPRYRLIAPQAHYAWTLQRVVRLPVLLAWRLLHQHERLAVLQTAHQVMRHGRMADRCIQGRIVIPGDNIHMLRPLEIIQLRVEAHQVSCHRNICAVLLDGVIFQLVAFQQAM
ncbi:hypothetical protein D3C73_873580 [compost metagenome]